MITNLLATLTITLTTNVVEHFPQHEVYGASQGQSQISGWYDVNQFHFENDPNPTQKDVVTEIHKITHLQFQYDGAPYGFDRDEILSAITNHFQLDNRWLPSTNSLPVPMLGSNPFVTPCNIQTGCLTNIFK